jgi:hypothetical protein
LSSSRLAPLSLPEPCLQTFEFEVFGFCRAGGL